MFDEGGLERPEDERLQGQLHQPQGTGGYHVQPKMPRPQNRSQFPFPSFVKGE